MSYTIRATVDAGSADACEEALTVPELSALMATDPLGTVAITGDAVISAIHANKVLQVNKASNVTLTLPQNLAVGFAFIIDQVGVGLAIFVTSGGATKVNRSSFDRTAGAGAMMNAYVRSNADGASAVWVLGGDGATA